MANNAPIGVCDSGIGGLTVVKELLKMMPQEDFIYFGDTARTPYGSRPKAEIITFMHQILQFFEKQGVKMVVFACNTMTALGLEEARKSYPFMVIGTNRGVRSALKYSNKNVIGVLATQATIDSGKHCADILEIDPRAQVYPQACPQFVPLVESEKISGSEVEQAVQEYVGPMKAAHVDTVILGCTHYPFLQDSLQSFLGDDVVLINPARDTAADARSFLSRSNQASERKQGSCRLCFSADLDRAERLAKMILDQPVSGFEQVELG